MPNGNEVERLIASGKRAPKRGNCCVLGKSKYIDTVNRMLLAGTPRTKVWKWLKDKGVKISRNTVNRHYAHLLDPSTGIAPLAGGRQRLEETMRRKKQDSPIQKMSSLLDLVDTRVVKLMKIEETEDKLNPRVDRMIEQLYKMMGEYAKMVGEQQSDQEYVEVELVLTLIQVFQKIPIFGDLDVKHRFVESCKDAIARLENQPAETLEVRGESS